MRVKMGEGWCLYCFNWDNIGKCGNVFTKMGFDCCIVAMEKYDSREELRII